MKRRIKVWNKIKLYEASVVGIPAYPDAHASIDSFSLIKALSNANLKPPVEEGKDVGDELNMEETETMEEKSQSAEIKKQEESEETEKPEDETDDEAEKKSDMSAVIAKAIKDGIKDGLKELETERGVVDKQQSVSKSLGELAIEQGLFVKK